MNKAPVDIDRFLPYGEMLRGFLEQPFLSKSDLSSLLRSRGIFVNRNEKIDTIPWITNLLISPLEFDNLREAQNTKEDSPKVNTQTIRWSSSSALIDCVPDKFDLNSVLDLEFSNFKVVGSPNFIPVNGNSEHLLLEFKIERNDYSKSWISVQSIFKGSLELKKIKETNEVRLVMTHSANETKYVAGKAATGIVKHFKDKNYVSAGDNIKKIEFGHFTNPGRIEYLLSLTQNVSSSLVKFEDLIDVEFSPEKESPLPEKIKWMEKQIEDLKLNGKGLQDTFIVKEKNLHPYVLLYAVLARYKYDYKGLIGKCTVSIGFPDFAKAKAKSSELEVNIKNLSFEQTPKHITREQIIKIILDELDNIKLNSINALKGNNKT
jgi:hypothetical protein